MTLREESRRSKCDEDVQGRIVGNRRGSGGERKTEIVGDGYVASELWGASGRNLTLGGRLSSGANPRPQGLRQIYFAASGRTDLLREGELVK